MSESVLETTVDKFIFRVKSGNSCAESVLWSDMEEANGVVRIELSDYLQQSSGDVTFLNSIHSQARAIESIPDPEDTHRTT